jgi:ethanolamine utilization protein EutN
MIICTVIGNMWATKKMDGLNGLKLMIVQDLDPASGNMQKSFVAVDCVGAGIGERVLVATGSSARRALRNQENPVDAAIVAIVDEVQTQPEN